MGRISEEWVKVLPKGDKYDRSTWTYRDSRNEGVFWQYAVSLGTFVYTYRFYSVLGLEFLQQMEEDFQVQLENLKESFLSERGAMTQKHDELKKVWPD